MKKEVLIVDDDPEVRQVLSVILEAEFAVSAAPCGEEALALLKRRRFALVLLDVMMPGIGGVATLEGAFSAGASMPIVMLTAEQDIALARRCLDLGARAYITKPFESGFIRKEVNRLLAVESKRNDGRPWRVADPASEENGP